MANGVIVILCILRSENNPISYGALASVVVAQKELQF